MYMSNEIMKTIFRYIKKHKNCQQICITDTMIKYTGKIMSSENMHLNNLNFCYTHYSTYNNHYGIEIHLQILYIIYYTFVFYIKN